MWFAWMMFQDRRAAKEFAYRYEDDMNIARAIQTANPDLEKTQRIDVHKVQSQQDFDIGSEWVRQLEGDMAVMGLFSGRHEARDSGNYTGKHEGTRRQVKAQARIVKAKEETHTYGKAVGHKGGKHK